MSRRKKLQLPVNSSSPASCSVISSYFKTNSESKPEKSLKLSKFIASEPKAETPVGPSVTPKKSILNFLNLDEDIEKTPLKKVKKAPAPRTRKPKKEKVSKKQPKIKSALLKQEEALSEAITYQSLTEDIDPDELRLALAISRSEAESKGLPVDDLESLRKFTFTKQARTTKPSWLKAKGKWANKISALTYRDPEVELKRLQERVALILEGFEVNLNLPRPSVEESEGSIFIFTSPDLCGLLSHKKLLNRGEDQETIESIEDYYIAGLFEPSTAKAGHLLKSYKFIPGREISPKKNMESAVYEILDDCEIIERIERRSSSQKISEEKENTFQEYDVTEEEKSCEIVEVKRKSDGEAPISKDDFVENDRQISNTNEESKDSDPSKDSENTSNLMKKHELVECKTPCGSPLEKRKKFEEVFMSPDLFFDSDDDDNALNQGVVEIVSDEEEPKEDKTPIINQTPFKPPAVKNTSQLFGTQEPMSQRSTITVKTSDDDIFDLTQSIEDNEIEEHILAPEAKKIQETPKIVVPEIETDGNDNLSPVLETFDLTQCLDSDQEEEKNELRAPSPELFDLTEDLDLETKSQSSDDCIVLSDDEDECIKLQNDSVKEVLGNNSQSDAIGEIISLESSPKESPSGDPLSSNDCMEKGNHIDEDWESLPKKRFSIEYNTFFETNEIISVKSSAEGKATENPLIKKIEERRSSVFQPIRRETDEIIPLGSIAEEKFVQNPSTSINKNKRTSVFHPIEEDDDESPPKKRRSRSFEGDANLSPESTKSRRSKSFHDDNNSPVNVCNLTFEELRAKYGLSKQPTPNKEVAPPRKSLSQPAPTTAISELDDDDFFDQLIKNKFKRRSMREPSPVPSTSSEPPSQPNSASTPKTSRVSLTQPVPSTSKAALSVPGTVPSTPTKPSQEKKKTPKKRKAPQKKKAKDEEEVVIDNKIYIIKTENVPEKPDYSSMDKETLSVHLKKFGLKELTRKQSVALLEHIFNQMHPLMVDETDEE